MAEHVVGRKGGKMQEEKEQDKVGEAGNPVSLSQGFGGVMGSKTEKVCWRKFMMLHKTQKPTLTLLKRKMGWERLSYKDCLIGNLRGGPSWSRKGACQTGLPWSSPPA